jgi:hypothetical protein
MASMMTGQLPQPVAHRAAAVGGTLSSND